MTDSIIKIGDSVIQHGSLNNRVYLMKTCGTDIKNLIDSLNQLAIKHSYTKIFAKIPEKELDMFLREGYIIEAQFPGLFFLSKYYSEDRAIERCAEKIQDIINIALSRRSEVISQLPKDFSIISCTLENADKMSALYKKVFESYPFAIDEPEYIIRTMQENVNYYSITHDNKLVALSSSEINFEHNNAEMTDFATLPEYRGHNLSLHLLLYMESQMQAQGIKTLYTIARALSYGMNITFAKAGYAFAGTLTNNTNICGNFESMNVWYKLL